MINILSKTKYWAVAALALAAISTTFTACKKDDDKAGALTVTSIKAGGRDINSSTAPQDVPVGSNIVIRFNRNVNAVTATSSNVTLFDSRNAAVATDVTAAGDSVVVNPKADLALGSNFTLKIATGLKAADGGVLASEVSRQFKAYGPANIDPPQLATQTAYWNFNNTVIPTAGAFNVSYNKNSFAKDRFGFDNSAAYFNGVDDIIEVDNGRALLTTKTTISYWVKFDTAGSPQGDFVMGLNLSRGFVFEFFDKFNGLKQAASFEAVRPTRRDTVTDDLFTNGDGGMKDNGGWQGWEFAKLYPAAQGGIKAVLKDKWVHVISTFEPSTTRWTLYINGEKAKVVKWDLWPTGDAQQFVTGYLPRVNSAFSSKLAFGFGQARDSKFENPGYGNFDIAGNNHFKGWLDDVRFLNATFSDADAAALYNAERVK